MSTYKKGDIVIGTVANVRPYAVFLNFPDGAVGLLHISEISDSFIRDIEKYASIGDEIKVIVISVDPDNGFLYFLLADNASHFLNDYDLILSYFEKAHNLGYMLMLIDFLSHYIYY